MERRFKRTFASLQDLFGFTESFLGREGIAAEHRYAVHLAVEELFTNLVKYNRDNDNSILLQLERVGERLTVRLTDFDVEPFDPSEVGEVRTDQPLAERRPGGLGLFLTGKMMDGMDYEYADRESRITVFKNLR